MDLVIQSLDLPTVAVDAFKVACVARSVKRKLNSARLTEIQDDADTRKGAAALGNYWKCDVAFVRPDLRLADFRVLAMDMDSTLITIECVDEIASFAGKKDEVSAITAAAMRGELDFEQSLLRRARLLAGLDASVLQQVYDDKLRLSPGAEELISAVKRAGLKTLLVSGGFTFFTDRLRGRLGLDFTCSNTLAIADGRLTGEVSGPDGAIVGAHGKANALRRVCAEVGCPTEKAIAIGDGANDLKMLNLAGISVAYRAKPVVQQQATQALNFSPLSGVAEWFADQ